jgi:hypothetical protein
MGTAVEDANKVSINFVATGYYGISFGIWVIDL